MAAESCRKRLQDEVSCSVCLEYFAEPVSLDCGHNFCRACIAQCWGESLADASCPQCRERVQPGSLRPNRQLANMVELVKELGGLPRQAAAGGAACVRHQEPLKLFCRDDEALICVVCDRAKEHRAHRVVPVDEAAQEYQNQIGHTLESLRKERGSILHYKAANEKESQDLLKQMEAEREKTARAFRQLHQFLEEQEKLLLAQMEEVEKEIAEKRDEHLAGLSAELSSLDSLIRELEEKQQQSANELLLNIGSTLKRCKEESFENPVAFPVALKWKIHDFSDINPFLEAIMQQFQDTLICGLHLEEEHVTLDPDTAHPRLILSEDYKSVRWGDTGQDLPDNPERFDVLPAVLGREGFTSGRHFWEVTVQSEENWFVGVTRQSIRRKGKLDIHLKELWVLGRVRGNNWAQPPDALCVSQIKELNTIRVTLNYEGGRVAFFDADSGVQLYTCSGASFAGETLLPLFYMFGKAHLSLPP